MDGLAGAADPEPDPVEAAATMPPAPGGEPNR